MLHAGIFPAGVLVNAKTGRFHPILFRIAPMPGGADANLPAQRFKSLGHHTEGYDTMEAAKAHLAEEREGVVVVDSGQTWEWDGEDTPGMVAFFDLADLLLQRAKGMKAG